MCQQASVATPMPANSRLGRDGAHERPQLRVASKDLWHQRWRHSQAHRRCHAHRYCKAHQHLARPELDMSYCNNSALVQMRPRHREVAPAALCHTSQVPQHAQTATALEAVGCPVSLPTGCATRMCQPQGLTQTTSRASASERAEGKKASAACSRGAWAKPPCQKQGCQDPCMIHRASSQPAHCASSSTQTAQSEGPHYVPDAPHLRSARPLRSQHVPLKGSRHHGTRARS